MRHITKRLIPGELLKESIVQVVKENNIKAGVILAAVGGLENANIRVSKLDNGDHPVLNVEGPLEVVSCMGTLSADGCHVHVSVADRQGRCYGGHLKDGCRVFVTIELVILAFDDITYGRVFDDETGFEELTTD